MPTHRDSLSSSRLLGALVLVLAVSISGPVVEDASAGASKSTKIQRADVQDPPEIYVSTDIEADGPIPGPHSMLSLASAAFDGEGELIDSFSVNLELLEDASGHPDTMAWWSENEEAWEASRRESMEVEKAMADYAAWVEDLPGKPVFVAYPVAFDFMFVRWYLMRFVGHSPFGHSALDIRSFAMGRLGVSWELTTKRHLPRRWIPEAPHTHVALDDAIEQGRLFCNMLREARPIEGLSD